MSQQAARPPCRFSCRVPRPRRRLGAAHPPLQAPAAQARRAGSPTLRAQLRRPSLRPAARGHPSRRPAAAQARPPHPSTSQSLDLQPRPSTPTNLRRTPNALAPLGCSGSFFRFERRRVKERTGRTLCILDKGYYSLFFPFFFFPNIFF